MEGIIEVGDIVRARTRHGEVKEYKVERIDEKVIYTLTAGRGRKVVTSEVALVKKVCTHANADGDSYFDTRYYFVWGANTEERPSGYDFCPKCGASKP